MSTILEDLWGNCYQDQFWIWCDIDGHGHEWHLAIPISDDQIEFPIDHFDDYVEGYLKYPAREIVKPMQFIPIDMPTLEKRENESKP